MQRHAPTKPSAPSYSLLFSYSTISLSGAIINVVFNTYHLDLFLSVYKLPTSSLMYTQIIFAFWNTANDLLAGYFIDKISTTTANSLLKRVYLTRWAGICWTLTFLVPWFPLPEMFPYLFPFDPVAMHYLLSICLFDGFYSTVAIAYGSIMVELGDTHTDRVWLSASASVLGLCSSLPTAYLSYLLWDKTNLTSFRMFTLVLCCLSFIGYFSATTILESLLLERERENTKDIIRSSVIELTPLTTTENEKKSEFETEVEEKKSKKEWEITPCIFARQVIKQSNLVLFVSVNCLQEAAGIFSQRFAPIFLHVLLADFISHQNRSLLLSFMAFTHHLFKISMNGVIAKTGVYIAWKTSFRLKLILASIGFFVGPSWRFIVVFLIINGLLTEGIIGALFPITLGELIDEDQYLNQRESPLAAMFYGTNALVAKPFNGLFTLIGSYVLAANGYTDSNEIPGVEHTHWASEPRLFLACFYLLLGVPLSCSIVQNILWMFYTLHGDRIRKKGEKQISETTELVTTIDQKNINS